MAKNTKAPVDKSKPRPGLAVVAKQDSRWRIGRNFGRSAVAIPLDELEEGDIKALEDDGQLVVTPTEIAPEAPAQAS